MKEKITSTGNALTFYDALFLILIALKVTDNINMSWFMVLAIPVTWLVLNTAMSIVIGVFLSSEWFLSWVMRFMDWIQGRALSRLGRKS